MDQQAQLAIDVTRASKLTGSPCRTCNKGTLEPDLDHDAMTGNKPVLRCTNRQGCGKKFAIAPRV